MSTTAPQGTILGHPKGLFVLFFTELWERFNYYGMRAILAFYMTEFFLMTQQQSSGIYKWFTALCYLTPIIGGYIADRYIGNKWAIILGASTMAIGQFCMTIPEVNVFYLSLVIIVIGNGLFKPNMATQVGRLYPPNDARRDSAYTIFYMGINIGAMIAPLLCEWLRGYSYKYAFGAAGTGMLIGLFTYLFFIRWVQEAPTVPATTPDVGSKPSTPSASKGYMTEAEANVSPSIMPALANSAPTWMAALAVLAVVGCVALWQLKLLKPDDALAFGMGTFIACSLGAIVLRHIHGAARDRVLTIYLLGLFVIFFWAAFEQAGNAMNIFAAKTTNLYVSEEAPPPPIYPAVEGEPAVQRSGGWLSFLNPILPGWYQAVNAAFIILFAPLFAWLWVKLPRMGINLSVPAKMAIGIFLQGMAFALMVWAIRYENQPTSVPLSQLPPGVIANAEGRVQFRDAPDLNAPDWQERLAVPIEGKNAKVVNGGRIFYAPGEARMSGVLSDTDRDRLLRASAPPGYMAKVRELALASQQGSGRKDDKAAASVQLDEVPVGLDLRYAGLKEGAVTFDPESRVLSTTVRINDRHYKALLVAGADQDLRNAMNKLYVESAKNKVSWQWLIWFYLLCTLGELCLSPVGLSMVSKLAPKAYGTMLMGTWHLMISFGNYIAGLMGESYGTLHPATYFMYITVALTVVSFICFLLVKRMRAMMHGVM